MKILIDVHTKLNQQYEVIWSGVILMDLSIVETNRCICVSRLNSFKTETNRLADCISPVAVLISCFNGFSTDDCATVSAHQMVSSNNLSTFLRQPRLCLLYSVIGLLFVFFSNTRFELRFDFGWFCHRLQSKMDAFFLNAVTLFSVKLSFRVSSQKPIDWRTKKIPASKLLRRTILKWNWETAFIEMETHGI